MIEKFNNPVIDPDKCRTPGKIAGLPLRGAILGHHPFHSSSQY
jgi:hypothetical protein